MGMLWGLCQYRFRGSAGAASEPRVPGRFRGRFRTTGSGKVPGQVPGLLGITPGLIYSRCIYWGTMINYLINKPKKRS